MTKNVKDDRRKWDRIISQLQKASVSSVTIGLHDDLGVHPGENNDDNLTYAQIGSIQEFGAKNRNFPDGKKIDIPSRPFTRETFDRNKSVLIDEMKGIVNAVSNYVSAVDYLDTIGHRHAERQKKVMRDWADPPNSPRTVKLKGFNDPLVNSGSLIKGVKHKVR